jgi:two-component system NtrC family response regulator
VLTGQHDRENAVRAVGMGAYDFFAKPFEPELLALTLDRALRMYDLQQDNRRLKVQQGSALSGVITRDAGMLKVCRLIEKVASANVTVMLLGESGTGKEVLAGPARAVAPPQRAFRGDQLCGDSREPPRKRALRLRKGAFTGAVKQTLGKIEVANKGTLFLDEIGDLPMPLQAKLLRFLQERVIERIGGREEIPVDVRIVCATHQDVKGLIQTGRFREDLYYRLAEIVVDIPALRSGTVTRCCWRMPSCSVLPTITGAVR